MPYLNRDGVNIYYEERGKGPAALLSHGYSAFPAERYSFRLAPISLSQALAGHLRSIRI